MGERESRGLEGRKGREREEQLLIILKITRRYGADLDLQLRQSWWEQTKIYRNELHDGRFTKASYNSSLVQLQKLHRVKTQACLVEEKLQSHGFSLLTSGLWRLPVVLSPIYSCLQGFISERRGRNRAERQRGERRELRKKIVKSREEKGEREKTECGVEKE